ncbi:MAG: TonB-dependent receptor, partial [Bacteroidota bacterium]
MVRLQLFLALFLLAFAMNAQPLLDRKITFAAENEALESVLYRLGELPGIALAFSNEILPKTHKVSLPKTIRTLRSTLRQLFRHTNIHYKVIGGQIVLYHKKRKLKEYILSGYVEDIQTGERLIGANIYLPEYNVGTSSNAYGFYSIRLQEGKKLINYSYLGYQKQTDTIQLRSNVVQTILLKPSLTLNEVIVTARDTTLPSISIFSSTISPDDMKRLPAVGGENDVIRYAAFLPGVQTGADGVGGMNVRGGSVDQNMILLDGVTVYNPSHLIGVFSIFNPSAIKSANLIKGRFPARYGGRLSSFLDIHTKDGNNKRWGGEVGLGLSAMKLSIEGPLIKNKSSLFVSARTSPLSWLIEPVSRRIKERRNQEGFTSYQFHDINAKWNYSFSDQDNIYVSFYRGGDAYQDRGRVRYTVNSIYFNEDLTAQDLSWGNTIGAFRCNHVFGNRLFLNTSLTYSKYHFESEGGFYHTDTLITDGSVVNEALLSHFSSRIEDVGAKMYFDYKHSPHLNMHFGVDYTRHAFTPGLAANTFNLELDFGDFTVLGTLFDTLNNPTIPAHELAIYLENHWTIGQKLKFNLGLRSSSFLVRDRSYHALQPRLDVSYDLTDQMQIHAAYSFMQQFLHLLTTSGVGLPTDLWVPSTQNIKPQSSAQFVFGWGFRTKNQFWINVEAYYKRLNDIIDFASDSSLG